LEDFNMLEVWLVKEDPMLPLSNIQLLWKLYSKQYLSLCFTSKPLQILEEMVME